MKLSFFITFISLIVSFNAEGMLQTRVANRYSTTITPTSQVALLKKNKVQALIASKSAWGKIAEQHLAPAMVRCKDGAIATVNTSRMSFFKAQLQYKKSEMLTIDELDSVRLQKACLLDAELAAHDQTTLKKLKNEELITRFEDLAYLGADQKTMLRIAHELLERSQKNTIELDLKACDLLNHYYQSTPSEISDAIITGKIQKDRLVVTDEHIILNLSGLELNNLQGLESLSDVSWLNTTSIEGITFGDYALDDITQLDLSQNKLTQLTRSDLRIIKKLFPYLETLILDHNDITNFDKDALSEMDDFEISLNNNPLDIDLGMLKNYEGIHLSVLDTPTSQKHFDPSLWNNFIDDKYVYLVQVETRQQRVRETARTTVVPGMLRALIHCVTYLPSLLALQRADQRFERKLETLSQERAIEIQEVWYRILESDLKNNKDLLNEFPEIYPEWQSLKRLFYQSAAFAFLKIVFQLPLSLTFDFHGMREPDLKKISPFIDPLGYTASLPINFLIKKAYKRYNEPYEPCTVAIRKADEN